MDELEFAAWYKRAFSSLQAEKGFEVNLENGKLKKRWNRGFAAAFTAAVLLLACTTVYAENVCGIQRKMQIWIDGELTTVTVDFDNNGNYAVYDESGNETMSGGGIAYEGLFNRERAQTADELAENIADQITMKEDRDKGMYCLNWHNRTVILDDSSFDENGYAYVKLIDGDQTKYVTIRKDGSYASDPSKYPVAGKDFAMPDLQ